MSSHHSGRSRDRPREREERSRRDDRKKDDDRLREDRRRDERREIPDRHERRENTDRHRERINRDHERSRRKDSRSRSRSPQNRRKKRESPESSKVCAMNPQLLERPEITEKDLEGKTEEEQEMMKMMGFGDFDSTKGKSVTGNDVSAVNILQKRKYRQYMNRKGGFNRPLDFVA